MVAVLEGFDGGLGHRLAKDLQIGTGQRANLQDFGGATVSIGNFDGGVGHGG
jgi:hypothetical protein